MNGRLPSVLSLDLITGGDYIQDLLQLQRYCRDAVFSLMKKLHGSEIMV